MKRQNRTISNSGRYNSDIIDYLPDPTFAIDTHGRVIIWNHAIEELTGVSSSDILGKDNFEHSIPFYNCRRPVLANFILNPDLNLEQYYTTFNKIRDTINTEVCAPSIRNGEARLVGVARPVYDADGRIICAVETVHDITDDINALNVIIRKKELEYANIEFKNTIRKMEITQHDLLKTQEKLIESNRQLEFSEEKYSKTLHLGPVIISLSRLSDGKYIEVSDYFLQHMGYSRDEVIGHSAMDLNIWADASDRDQVIDIIKRDGVIRDSEFLFRSKQGQIFVMRYSAEIITIADEPYLVSVAIDITKKKEAEEERKKLELQLLQSQKMETVGRLAGGIAHDFNNLLTAILGNVELSMMKISQDNPIYSKLDLIKQASESAADLTNRILAFSRKQIIKPEIIDLNKKIDQIHRMLERLIGENIKLFTSAKAGNPWIMADPGQVEQIIVNLAVNARDAMPDGGSLTIEADNVYLDLDYCRTHTYVVPGDYAVLSVNDTGSGMSEDVRSHIFEPFFTTKPRGKGTGLGLSMVYGSVKQNGGLIEVFSEEGKGTCIKIYFPVFTGEILKQAVLSDEKFFFKGFRTILLVEDNMYVRNFTFEVLEQAGYEVIEASSGEEALEKAKTCGCDIAMIITDVVLPGINGKLLVSELGLIRPGIKVLFISGYTDAVITQKDMLDENINFIGKPYSAYTLLKKIQEVLGW